MTSCKKKDQYTPSSDKEITSFSVFVSSTESIMGTIRNDSILVQIPPAVTIDSVFALVKFKGISTTPTPDDIVNFTHPVIYTVTAEDGSTRLYTVVISYLNSDKEITAFVFKSAENAGLKEDLVGTIEDSSISVTLSSNVDISKLKPAIIFKGTALSPANGATTDFSNGATYTVTAEDHSTKSYSVIVSYNKFVYIGSADGYVYALDGASGKVKWKYNTGYQLSHPIYKDGVLYVGSNDGTFFALDGETGALKWKFFNQKTNYTAPHIQGDVVYVGFYITNYSTGVFAINARTGGLLWKTFFPGVGSGGQSGPTYSDGFVYVSDFNGGLYALDATTGKIKWNNNVGISMSNPAVSNGVVYISCETAMLDAFDGRTGDLKWSSHAGLPNTKSSPTILNGVVYTAGDDGYLFALDANDGSLKWKAKGNEIDAPIEDNQDGNSLRGFGSPVISDGLLFVGNYACNTYVFDVATGTPKWNYNNNGGQQKGWQPGPAAAHGMMVTDRGDNMLKAFYASTGKLMWTFTAGGLVNTYPCIVDFGGNAFYAGAAGNMN